ncbi:endonuclease MutS2 [Salipaludibacillus aurantiacus]|uniref:MutS2 family protein n=1 Tax=Salipaludibacillus aurantiacus TaxID=1601833 RepID=A0A1H9S319_9BACI|nr:endonuclease MutS2 [Salipaludibacillus aurantiacus]SER79391.1 MutS2 family protein [Salipaludibacillus aurantiacus]
MNQSSLQQLDYDNILNTVASFAHTDRAKETIMASEPKLVKKHIDQMLIEVNQAARILDMSSSVPIHSLDEVATYLKQAHKGLFLRPDQLERVVSFLEHCRKLKTFMKDKTSVAPDVANYVHSIADMTTCENEISGSLRHGKIDDYATPELANIRRHLRSKQAEVKEKAEAMCRSKKMTPYLQESMVVEKNGHFTIPVKKQYRSKVNGSVVDTSASGATVFMEPTEVAAIYEELNHLIMAEEHEVETILYQLTALVLEIEPDLHIAMETMHHYDVIFAKAKYGRSIDGIVPELNESFTIHIDQARHPLLGEKAVPLSLQLGLQERALVITGPNTGGKTVTLKTVGLLTLMAQTGLMIPAGEKTSLHIFQKIYVDIGDGQSIEQNLSTFSSRLTNIIDILEHADDKTLVLIDELGSGTDPNEGMALAQVILEQMFAKGSTIFATTHYRELKSLAQTHEGFLNGSMAFDVQTLQPTYRLLLGETGNSQAFDIAYKLGLHPELIKRAHQLSDRQSEADRFAVDETDQAQKRRYEKQLATTKYARKQRKQKESSIPIFNQGDNVTVSPKGSVGIVYKGPDETGNYIVQIKGEKHRVNHKRLTLKIPARDLYPEDYDFDIIFKSVEYRKTKHKMDRKHVESLTLHEEEN